MSAAFITTIKNTRFQHYIALGANTMGGYFPHHIDTPFPMS